MLSTENQVYRYKELAISERQWSPVVQEVGNQNLQLFARVFKLDCDSDIYKKLRYNSYDIPLSIASTLQSIYDLYHKTWECRWYLVHLLNTIRVMQGRMHAQPVSDNQFRIKDRQEVLPNVNRVVAENSHFELDNSHMKLLQVSLVNYFLRQIDYPLIIGGSIVRDGFNEDTLEKELSCVLALWLGDVAKLEHK